MKLDRSLYKRLSELERGNRTETPAPTTAAGAPAPAGSPPLTSVRLSVGEPEELHGALEELLPGVLQTIDEGQYYEIVSPVAAYGEWAVEAVQCWGRAAAEGRVCGLLAALGNATGDATVFFDTETTGLNNEPLFLVGLLCYDEGGPYLRQLLARDYVEEPAVLAETRRALHQAALVVSYNGTSFDLPYVQNRLRYHRLGRCQVPHHLDLLPVARRKLGRSLGNCRLQTLERHLCGRERRNDIAGAAIPQAYHDFVADGDAGRLRRIVEHNCFDVITLAELAAHLARD